MLSKLSIRNRLIFLVSLLLLLAMSATTVLTIQLENARITERLLSHELPARLQAIRSDILADIKPAIANSRQLATSPFVIDWIENGEAPGQVKTLMLQQLRTMGQRFGADTVFLRTAGLNSAYDEEGQKTSFDRHDPGFQWFFEMLDGNVDEALVFDVDNTGVARFFVDIAVRGADGAYLGVAGMGINVSALAERIREYRLEQTGYVYLADSAGRIQVHPHLAPGAARLEEHGSAGGLPSVDGVRTSRIMKDGEPWMAASIRVPGVDWHLVAEVPESEALAAVHDSTLVSIGIAIAAILAGLVLTVLVAGSIAGPVAAVADRLEAVAAGGGDLSIRIPVQGSDEVARLAQGFNRFVTQLQTMIGEIADTSGAQTRTADQLRRTADDGSRASAGVRDETTQVAAAITEMGATVQEIAASAANAARMAQQAADRAGEGRTEVERNIHAIEQLSGQMGEAAQVIGAVADHSGRIGGILDVIRGISEQTNLLALNAAIEAARAGDAGRGFAVVADEVRSLAQRTAQSTEEIRQMIDQLQSETGSAVSAMGIGRELSDSSVQAVRRLGEVFGDIALKVEDISDMNLQVAAATEEQASVVGDIGRNVESINLASQVSSEAAASSAQAAQSLHRLTGTLEGLVQRFRY
ncbi:energy taxis-modulating methyl-accepting chemotaxis protein with Cache_1 sensory domain [Marinobacterium nitratireducens]|uniref:Energy taxis-modulating methyl-accepting chemotaxis protein with Cache_1 sensory domain n=1 Tax=Marinobacterium nitratireducens TaxID=518897 RepID=A0A917ZMS5_9GAMM|nr:methyl-accepting chemotaxis protein [Marinobacterium nitratireducens]GGO87352.1 energy taxis-modulating methyl-accepting chemotaxis protein with Cache_1 sensory domain [Marinobacterium nitratireducens]